MTTSTAALAKHDSEVEDDYEDDEDEDDYEDDEFWDIINSTKPHDGESSLIKLR